MPGVKTNGMARPCQLAIGKPQSYVVDTGRKRTSFHCKCANSISHNYL